MKLDSENEFKKRDAQIKSWACDFLSKGKFEDLGHSKIDLSRAERCGHGEVVYGAGKTSEQVVEIMSAIVAGGQNALATRLTKDSIVKIRSAFENVVIFENEGIAEIFVKGEKPKLTDSFIAIVCAGTSDLKVAKETSICAEFFGSRTKIFADCGVAGIHRLGAVLPEICKAKVCIAIAGMEGALPSVLAGLVQSPVIALPTSVGYGASFSGLAALLAMLNSCADGVSVVNIDNGFGAAVCAHKINLL